MGEQQTSEGSLGGISEIQDAIYSSENVSFCALILSRSEISLMDYLCMLLQSFV